MTTLTDYSETGLTQAASHFWQKIRKESEAVKDQQEWFSFEESSEAKLSEFRNDLYSHVPQERKQRVDILLLGLSWDLNYEKRRAEHQYKIFAALRKPINDVLRRLEIVGGND